MIKLSSLMAKNSKIASCKSEIVSAIKSIPSGKAAEIDGIPAEF